MHPVYPIRKKSDDDQVDSSMVEYWVCNHENMGLIESQSPRTPVVGFSQ